MWRCSIIVLASLLELASLELKGLKCINYRSPTLTGQGVVNGMVAPSQSASPVPKWTMNRHCKRSDHHERYNHGIAGKSRYPIVNWSEYNKSLVKRGSLPCG